MKIKTIKRVAFIALLAMPLLFALLSFVAPYIHGTTDTSTGIDYKAFFTALLDNLPDNVGESYVSGSVVELWKNLTGNPIDGVVMPILYYVSYGINIYLLWIAVDVFLGLPTILHRFIDKGVYNEK